jgi:hypothetical protein
MQLAGGGGEVKSLRGDYKSAQQTDRQFGHFQLSMIVNEEINIYRFTEQMQESNVAACQISHYWPLWTAWEIEACAWLQYLA